MYIICFNKANQIVFGWHPACFYFIIYLLLKLDHRKSECKKGRCNIFSLNLNKFNSEINCTWPQAISHDKPSRLYSNATAFCTQISHLVDLFTAKMVYRLHLNDSDAAEQLPSTHCRHKFDVALIGINGLWTVSMYSMIFASEFTIILLFSA